MNLQNKVVIITGASGGIGEAVAKELDAAGMSLVLTARSQDKLERLASKLQNAKVVPGEITNSELPQKLVDFAIQTFGQLDVVFNNAGVMTVGPIESVDIEAICQMVRVNVESAYRIAYTALRHFKQSGSGFLINTSSIAGLKTTPQLGAYCGTKFAIEAFTDSLRVELAGTDIRVSSIAPGTVDTGLYEKWDEEQKSFVYSGGVLQSADIARCVRFILEQPGNVLIPRLMVVPAAEPV
ncbi:SDR family oxidoreductase [Nostoc sp. 'Peltigera malacea cyanobiont' DB3992]|uniref:SDR family oxidoreductase n=1 Tax=Nostoc sp. 'Peltigera malacea cyanobiont' DB3992 TaxID=1206980 RepID=UPI000C053B92|nr:SDR family oxidoreductase [Nostoc sp. 'Peltigera malacea cyanobiont' DB3992]PHM11014.1 short-chain dehydrogenase [Nostoc sp. 'Peltigera malacea cyanobiont' DB3992]